MRIQDLIPGRSKEFVSSPLDLGPIQASIKWVPGALFLRVKWAGREADHSPVSSNKVKNMWIYTSTPAYVLMAWCLTD
jgi:hypothetical protein